MADTEKMEKLVSLAKRRGFIYKGSEIYGGISGMWDYGPNGIALRRNIENLWWRTFVESRKDMYGVDTAILMHPKVWEASGHTEGFTDLAVECKNCNTRSRADHIIEEQTGKDVEGESLSKIDEVLKSEKVKCPKCGKSQWAKAANLNQMFETSLGSIEGKKTKIYLRGETAAGMFTNFKNIVDTFHPSIPFGIAQIGRAFRNEISARDFIFRSREFNIMEFEYFIEESDWKRQFEVWKDQIWKWTDLLGIPRKKIKEVELSDVQRAHYSKRTVDLYYEFPFGFKELNAIAYRTDHDLSRHIEASGVDLQYFDDKTGKRFTPHVIEPTFGLERNVLAVFCEAYEEEKVGGEMRTVLKFEPQLAPVKIAVLPLMRKPELKKLSSGVYESLRLDFVTQYDETGSIGKRYRRQDEIGTPYCVTVDYDSLEDQAVTVRDRDTMKQERVAIAELEEYFADRLK